MRALSCLVFAIILASAAGVRTEQPRAAQGIGPWQLVGGLPRDRWVVWTQARGTVAAPDVCRDFATGARPETFTPAEAAAIRRQRAACLILSCEPGRDGRPPRYEATVLLFGAAGSAYDEVPPGRPRPRAEVVLRLDDGPLRLSVGLIEPLVLERPAKGGWSLVPFHAAPVERRTLERILATRTAVVAPVNQFFGAYIWVIPFTSGSYTFDLAGGATALARLDERCK